MPDTAQGTWSDGSGCSGLEEVRVQSPESSSPHCSLGVQGSVIVSHLQGLVTTLLWPWLTSLFDGFIEGESVTCPKHGGKLDRGAKD